MKFIHRIGLRATASQRREMTVLGMKLPVEIALLGGDPLLAFDVDEDHPNWPKLAFLFQSWQASDFLRTEFSAEEIDTARWLEIAAWHHGCPQPDESTFGFLRVTYDLADWCEKCGIGKKQKAPFQMRCEPKWGPNGILQMIWVYDELFVMPEVWSSIFRPRGIGCRAVLDRAEAELKTVVQLTIDDTVSIVTNALSSTQCPTCGRVKYVLPTRGAFPMLTDVPSAVLVKTSEYFGSGPQADRRILASQEIAHAFTAGTIRGASCKPVQAPP